MIELGAPRRQAGDRLFSWSSTAPSPGKNGAKVAAYDAFITAESAQSRSRGSPTVRS
jgi:hypothetical protein